MRKQWTDSVLVFAGLVTWTRKKPLKPNQTQLRATGLSVAVASFWSLFGCWMLHFENIQKPFKEQLQSVATDL